MSVTDLTADVVHTEGVVWQVSTEALSGVAPCRADQLTARHLLHSLVEGDPALVVAPADHPAVAGLLLGGETGRPHPLRTEGEGLVERDQGHVRRDVMLEVSDLGMVDDVPHDHDLHVLHVQLGGGVGRPCEHDPLLGVVTEAGDAGGGGEEGGGGDDSGRAGDLQLHVEHESQGGPGVRVSRPVSAA